MSHFCECLVLENKDILRLRGKHDTMQSTKNPYKVSAHNSETKRHPRPEFDHIVGINEMGVGNFSAVLAGNLRLTNYR